MRLSRIRISNFRNFSGVDVALGRNAVIVGENKVGKSNLMHALRLVLDPSLPDSARSLREEDFWDGLPRPLTKDDRIEISVEFTDFDSDENLLAVLTEHLVEPDPMVARLTYVWQPLTTLKTDPKKEADYEFLTYGGDRPENRVGFDVRRRIPMELLPALRDCEGDLARWTRSPLRPLLDKAAGEIDHDELETLAKGVDEATDKVAKVDQVKAVAESLTTKLKEMAGSAQLLKTALRFSPSDPDKLVRTLRLFIDDGRRGIADASLGSANLLYFALKSLEYDRLVTDGDRDHTLLAIEEPEAHLHPTLQRLIFRNYFRAREGIERALQSSATVLMTTHSPHIASVTPIRDFVVLRSDAATAQTEAVSTARLKLTDEDVSDLERYIDVNRGEILFARGVILVEGDAEKYLVPVLAAKQGIDLDELGISVCSIGGTNFAPYLKLLGPRGLNTPAAALTDMDPRPPKEDGTPRTSLGPSRVVDQMLPYVLDEATREANDFEMLLALADKHGVCLNAHTFEVDLFHCGLHAAFAKAIEDVGASDKAVERMKGWAAKPKSLDTSQFLKDIEAIGKGRFAQRIASAIAASDDKSCPPYILSGLEYVASKC